MHIAAKFGGSSLATAEQITKVVEILRSNPDRRYVVASAPGKRHSSDTKVTDLLYRLYAEREGDFRPTLDLIKQRFADIATGLGVTVDLDACCLDIESHLQNGAGEDYCASRGEYLNSLILAAHLDWPFVDAATAVCFSDDGEFLAEETNTRLQAALAGLDHAVIPGFYGSTLSGRIKTLSRGGSDVTGALVARATGAAAYENWTDVSGILMADPRLVTSPPPIERVSYVALRELTYMGATVLHEDAITPVREAGIPINIRNTNNPDHPGTWVESVPEIEPGEVPILGIAGKPGYAAVTVHKAQWCGTFGIAPALLGLFGDAQLIVDLALTGVDTWTMVVPSARLAEKLDDILADIDAIFQPDTVRVQDGLTLLAVVESGATARGYVTARLADALTDAGIESYADAFTGDLHVLAIASEQYGDAVRAVYDRLVLPALRPE
ncbi:MAG: aspartate kinase [Propionibacteriaceae bacterium]|jgi:aspartate kinase|nr:aspartate kinase [Propionibacteriaceae bacterium]